MATNLKNFAYKPKKAVTRSAAKANVSTSTSPSASNTLDENEAMADIKAEILASIRGDISELLRSELGKVLDAKVEEIKNEIQAVKTEVVSSITQLRTELNEVKGKVSDMEYSLTTCSDDVADLQSTVATLRTAVKGLQERHVDLESRMRRSNIRILNVPEDHDSSPPSVSKILKMVFGIDKDVMVDRSHRTPPSQRVAGKPRPIIAKLHYYQDCVDVLRRARQAGGALKYGQTSISIFQDYPPSVARARSAYNQVKQLLRGRAGVRYGVIHPAKFRVSHDGIEKVFTDPETATAYVKMNIVAANPGSSED